MSVENRLNKEGKTMTRVRSGWGMRAACVAALFFIGSATATAQIGLDDIDGEKRGSSFEAERSLAEDLSPRSGLRMRTSLPEGFDPDLWLESSEAPSPVGVVEQSSDAFWASDFGRSGVDGYVNAIVEMGSDIIVGGKFQTIQGVVVNNLARWDGNQWSDIGGGVNGTVFDLAVNGSSLYVGGKFSEVGGTPANHIARWTGSTWDVLSGGVTGGYSHTAVFDIEVSSNGAIYVGGFFGSAGGVVSQCVAKLSSGSWSSMGGGLASAVYALESNGAAVWAGGRFSKTANGVEANKLAYWSGSNWSSNPTNTDGDIHALLYDGTSLFIGGDFQVLGGASASYIGRYLGGYQSLAGASLNGPVHALASDNGSGVWVGGKFDNVGSFAARWNNGWGSLSGGLSGTSTFGGVFAVYSSSSGIIAGGSFSSGLQEPVSNLAKWANTGNGLRWQSVDGRPPEFGMGTDGPVRAIRRVGSSVLVGGYFSSVGGEAAGSIAAWDGTSWTTFRDGVTEGAVLAIAGNSINDFYIGGTFTEVDGQPCQRVARWNGTSWNCLGSGISGGDFPTIFAMTLDTSGRLIAGGRFSEAGGASVSNVAYWSGSTWSSYAQGVDGGSVLALTVNPSNGRVYVGGSFDRIVGGSNAGGLVYASSGALYEVSGGTDGEVHALLHNGSSLYVAGSFGRVGSQVANRVAEYTSGAWQTMSGLVGDAASALAEGSDGTIYVAGSFTDAIGSSVRHVGRWNGSTWEALGSGTNAPIRALGMINNELHVGGYFVSAGNKPSYYFGKWDDENNLVNFADLKIALAGPYQGPDMGTNLGSLIPLAHPFGGAPWNVPHTPDQDVTTIPNSDVVDWVLIELRNGPAASTSVAKQTAFVLSDGTVVSHDGITATPFSGVGAGPYYVIIHHRNHLAVITPSPILLSSSP